MARLASITRGANPEYHRLLEEGGLRLSGVGEAGEIRIVEIYEHPFFLAILFLPQSRSTRAEPHPVRRGYAAAAAASRRLRLAGR